MSKSCIEKELKKLEGSALVGIDGMIDEVWELVDNRASDSSYVKVKNLERFGNEIIERGTGGMSKERILKRRGSGGFVCNTGRTVATFDVKTVFLGMFGEEPYGEDFEEFYDLGEVYSVGSPAHIHVLEFVDGKILMPNLEPLIRLRWDAVIEKYGNEKVKQMFNQDIIGLGYWSNIYDFENILGSIVNICIENQKTKRVFHDFANLRKRTPEAVVEALGVLKAQDMLLPQTLSLNEHEGGILCEILGIEYPRDINNPNSMQEALSAVEKIRDEIQIDEVIIHALHFAISASKNNGIAYAYQNYCENTVKTTGAGDTFNGGYMMASLTNLSQKEKLIVANASTYHYVSTGKTPTKEQVLSLIS